ncbi:MULTISPECIES: MgtC/SapB family protein [Sphingobacterium]|uniref:Protein MgtC n=2 Tax=Sphingobacterium TaxID=28453 RepID=A0A420BLE2_SPHD1|nr:MULTISPECIES: MgtC/SapB family protein [Sphingobacterium]RKE57594.1 putative Mg2+ transporter-C (MgtC) family protein [Sphingobacterium detergens]ULT22979.1 MgtC/SapB family protein [Sphingobacterium sp. E70]
MVIFEFALRLLAALLLGAAVGSERQWRQKNAGLRTNTLVSLGSAAFVLLSIEIGGDATGRIASYVVSGIGFLGAGVIMKDGLNVHGLNTAATIWCSAAVGALSGLGLYPQAALVAAAIILTHLIFRPIGQRMGFIKFSKSAVAQTDYLVSIRCGIAIENHIRVLLIQMLGNEEKVLLTSLSSDDTVEANAAAITAVIKAVGQQDSLIERIASRLTMEEKVSKISWEIIGTEADL